MRKQAGEPTSQSRSERKKKRSECSGREQRADEAPAVSVSRILRGSSAEQGLLMSSPRPDRHARAKVAPSSCEREREEEGGPSGEDEPVLPCSPDGKLERRRERNGLLVQCMARRERLGVRETRKYSGRGQVGLEGRGAGFGTAPSWKNRRFAASSFSSDMLRAQGRAQRSALGPRSRGEGGGGEGEGRTGATCSAAWP